MQRSTREMCFVHDDKTFTVLSANKFRKPSEMKVGRVRLSS